MDQSKIQAVRTEGVQQFDWRATHPEYPDIEGYGDSPTEAIGALVLKAIDHKYCEQCGDCVNCDVPHVCYDNQGEFMQSEETVGNHAAITINYPSEDLRSEVEGYESNALAARAGNDDYPFDAGTLHIEVPHGENVVTIKYSKPELKDYLARQSALHSKTRVVGGAIVGGDIKHDADTDFFDTVVLSATKRKKTGSKVEKEYDHDACLRFPFELKVKTVKRMTTFRFKVECDGDELSDEPTVFRVTQTIGDAPDYTIVYQMNAIPEKQRIAYINAVNTKSRIKNGDTIIESEPHFIEKAMKLFGGDRVGKDANFISLEGGRLERGPFTQELKSEFVAQIDPMFQVGVVDAICDYYGGGSD